MEAAIAWLIETILATLLIDKLDAWLRRVGLADDIEKLKSEIRRIKIVLSAVKERGIGNELLAESLSLIRDHLDDADNVVDELDYYRLQQQVQGVTMDEPQGMHGAEQVDEISNADTPINSSVGKLRSVVWEHFTITEKDNGRPIKAKCTHCAEEFKCETKTNGTSSMKKHLENEHSVTFTKKPPAAPHPPNPSSACEPIATGSSSRRKGNKRRSKAWELFDIIVKEENGQPIEAKCKYCLTKIKCGAKYGTAGMLNHNKICKKKPGTNDQPANPSSTGDDPSNRKRRGDEEAEQITAANTHTPWDEVILSSTSDASANATPIVIGDSSNRKRRRVDEESAQIIAANTHSPWNKTILSNMIQKITSQLQDSRGEVTGVLKLHGSDSASSSNHHQSRGLDQHLRTSSFAPREVYGRVIEKSSIIKMITQDKSDCVAVLPIVGIAGVGKTVLAQLVYNDLDVKKLFHHRIWVWVSRNFDEVRLVREMLDFIPQERTEVHEERHERISSFAKLQEILARRANSKRLLFILDDVWDDMTDGRWENLLKPIKSVCANGSVILVTTRDVSVAKMTGTTEHTKLGALEHEELRLLFKSHAFGDENYMEDQKLSIIGQKIAEKLKGNPLAAESTGKLLRRNLSTDYWENFLKNEDWKSLQLFRGIMPALKLSYDQLPYDLQQSFAYCSIFPDGYQFHGGELACIWISQGFVKGNHSSKIFEEIERNYLTPLVNLGFFQQVEREESSPGSQTCYAVCGLMHDFARMVSLTECGTIDGLHCNKMSPTIRHLSIVTDSEYKKDEHGNIPRNEKFEKNLRDTVTSVSKLRTLVLLGHYDSFFSQLFQDIFEKAHNLRLLQMFVRSADFPKCGYDKVDGALPRVLSKMYHLRVLNVGSYTDPTIPDGINNLVSLQHLVVHKGVCFSVATIDNMTSFNELHGFKYQISSGCEMTQPQTILEFVRDYSVHQPDNVKNLKEVYEAVLEKNELLEKLHLCWKELSEIGPNTKRSVDAAKEVLERSEVRQHLKSLLISGYRYNDCAISAWIPTNISLTSLQKLHLDDCGGWQILPPLDGLPFLKELILRNLEEVKEILVPSLEELVIDQMPKLERCSCTSVEGLSSRLSVMQIEGCEALKKFDLFENDDKFETEQTSWLPAIRKLILRDCPHLKVSSPLPPSTTCSELLISRVSTLPCMEGSSTEKLQIGNFSKYSDNLKVLDNQILEFHNLSSLKLMTIVGCQNLSSISFEGFSQLLSLKRLEIQGCKKLFSSDMIPDATHDDVTAANCKAFPSLESLSIRSCGIAGKWLSLLLRHAPDLEELHLEEKVQVEVDEEEEEEEEGFVHIPLNLISSLKKITIQWCPRLIFKWSEEGFSGFTSLQELTIWGCTDLLLSLMLEGINDDQVNGRWLLPKSVGISGCSQEMLQPCFPRNLTSLKKLVIRTDPGLESLQLQACTALEELTIGGCPSLTALEGLQSLGSLMHLKLYGCPGLRTCFESFPRQGYELFPRLETLETYDPSVLITTSFCNHPTSLRRLKLQYLALTEEQGKALVLHKSIQELEFDGCPYLVDLPAGLHLLHSLKRLKIYCCRGISRLPEGGLPLSLEELVIHYCSKELADQCRLLATSKLNVIINYCI